MKTPLFYIYWDGTLGVVQYLVENENVDTELKDIDERTVLQITDQNNQLKITDYFKEKFQKI